MLKLKPLKFLTKIKYRETSNKLLLCNNLVKKLFNDKLKKEEILIYVMNDKYSVKPDKEFRISHSTMETFDEKTKKVTKRTVANYGKL
jgi:hypothetical protein